MRISMCMKIDLILGLGLGILCQNSCFGEHSQGLPLALWKVEKQQVSGILRLKEGRCFSMMENLTYGSPLGMDGAPNPSVRPLASDVDRETTGKMGEILGNWSIFFDRFVEASQKCSINMGLSENIVCLNPMVI